jgi:hypothetical protein
MASFVLMPDLRPGDRLLDRYRVLHPISRGGMGAVYEAEDERLGRRVAIKVLLGEGAQDGFKMERFRREARATAAVAHPSLVGIYDLHLQGDPPFIVMELLAGESLHELLSQEGRLPPAQVVALAATLLDALAALHAIGVVHRDVKPANVIVSPDGTRATLIDLGVAQLAEGNLVRLTEAGVAVGTPAFMAPEQLTGDAIGPAVDVWSMGVLLYLCLTGQLPFPASNYAQLLGAVHLTQPTPVRVLAPQTPPELDAFVHSLLAKSVADRPRDASDALARLRKSTSGAISVLHVTRSQPVVRHAALAESPASPPTVLPFAPMRAQSGERTRLASRSAMVTTIAALLAGLGILTTCVVGGLLGAVFTQSREASLAPGAPALPGVLPRPNRLDVVFSGDDARTGETMRSVLVPQLEHCAGDIRTVPYGASLGFHVVIRGRTVQVDRLSVHSAWAPNADQLLCIESALRSTPWPANFRDGVVVMAVSADLR